MVIGNGKGKFWNDAADADKVGLAAGQEGYILNGLFSPVDNGGVKVRKYYSATEIYYKVII